MRRTSDGLAALLLVGLLALAYLPRLSARAPIALSAAALAALGAGVVFLGRQRAARRRRPGFASRSEVAKLLVRRPAGDQLVLGRLGRRLIAAEAGQSLLVVGPSQSGKTTSLALPALFDWAGPVLATSVKNDLVAASLAHRAARGEVAVFDPSGATALAGAGWSPLGGATSWTGARRVASALCSLGRHDGGMEDASYWYGAAERLLAPLLRAGALAGGTMGDVLDWLEQGEAAAPLLLLEAAGERAAARLLRFASGLDERQRSSICSTAQVVLDAYGDPTVAASERLLPQLTDGWLYEGGARTLYCCAPAREQARLAPVFSALVRQVLDAGFARASRAGRLAPPLLVLLDEAANVAPLPDLDQLVATSVGHGMAFLTVWQDLAQVEARYGARWATVVNNHRAKVVFPGVADPRTLELLSGLLGEVETRQSSLSRGQDGSWTRTDSSLFVPVAPAGWLRRLPLGHCLVVYGRLPPVLVRLRGLGASGRRHPQELMASLRRWAGTRREMLTAWSPRRS